MEFEEKEAALRRTVEELESGTSEAAERVTGMSKELEEVKAEFEKQAQILQQERHDNERRKEFYEQEKDEDARRLAEKDNRIAEVEETVKAVEAQYTGMIDSLDRQVKELKAELAPLREEHEKLVLTEGEEKHKLDNAYTKFEQMSERIKEFQEQEAESKRRVAELEDGLKQAEERHAREIEGLNARITDLEGELLVSDVYDQEDLSFDAAVVALDSLSGRAEELGGKVAASTDSGVADTLSRVQSALRLRGRELGVSAKELTRLLESIDRGEGTLPMVRRVSDIVNMNRFYREELGYYGGLLDVIGNLVEK